GVQLRCTDVATERGTDHQGHRDPALGPVAEPRNLRADLVERLVGEGQELQLGDGSKTGGRQAERCASDTCLSQRHVDDPVGAEPLLQAVGGPEDATEPADVLAEQQDPVVMLQVICECGANRLDHGQRRHVTSSSCSNHARCRVNRAGSSAYTWSMRSAAVGAGYDMACSRAVSTSVAISACTRCAASSSHLPRELR